MPYLKFHGVAEIAGVQARLHMGGNVTIFRYFYAFLKIYLELNQQHNITLQIRL